MDSQQLYAFIALTKYENMSRTAEVLHTSQSQISKLLSSLETELEVSLFDRRGRNIQLNEHGRLFLEYAQNAIDNMESGRKTMQELKNSTIGRVSFGIYAYGPILNKCVLSFYKKNPHVTFRYQAGLGRKQLNPHEIDIIICPLINHHYNYEDQYPIHKVLALDEYYVVCSPRFRQYPREVTTLSAAECCQMPFIIMGDTVQYTGTNDSTMLSDICRAAGNPNPNILFQVNEFAFKMLLVNEGVGVSLLPGVCIADARKIVPDLQVFSVENVHPNRTVILARKPDESMTSVSMKFWEHAMDFYNLH